MKISPPRLYEGETSLAFHDGEGKVKVDASVMVKANETTRLGNSLLREGQGICLTKGGAMKGKSARNLRNFANGDEYKRDELCHNRGCENTKSSHSYT